MPSKFCDIKDWTPSSDTREALSYIEEKKKYSDMLTGALILMPFVQLFSGKPGGSNAGGITSANVTLGTYAWNIYAEAAAGIPMATKKIIETKIAEMYIRARGKDLKFWSCMAKAHGLM